MVCVCSSHLRFNFFFSPLQVLPSKHISCLTSYHHMYHYHSRPRHYHVFWIPIVSDMVFPFWWVFVLFCFVLFFCHSFALLYFHHSIWMWFCSSICHLMSFLCLEPTEAFHPIQSGEWHSWHSNLSGPMLSTLMVLSLTPSPTALLLTLSAPTTQASKAFFELPRLVSLQIIMCHMLNYLLASFLFSEWFLLLVIGLVYSEN